MGPSQLRDRSRARHMGNGKLGRKARPSGRRGRTIVRSPYVLDIAANRRTVGAGCGLRRNGGGDLETRSQYIARKRRENEQHRLRTEADEAAQSRFRWPTRDETASRLAGQSGALTGLVAGVPRGAFHAVRDGVTAVNFASRLLDPTDAESSPRGQAAWDHVFRAADGVRSYALDRAAHPQKLLSDVGGHATQGPSSVRGKGGFADGFAIGANVGEGLFNVAGLLGGAAELRSIPELRALRNGSAAVTELPANASQRLIDYMATPDPKTMGSHNPFPRKTRFPGGSPVPKLLMDSVFNRTLPPPGTPRGVFYRYHFAIDPDYRGGPVKKAFGGGGWSGAKLGWTKYAPAARAWYGTPWQTKAAALGALAGIGAPLSRSDPAEAQR